VFEADFSSSARENKALKSELESMSSVKEQLKTKLRDYKQRLENVAKVESDRNQVQHYFTLLLAT
jgi:chaperonin cofactor prefoldin